MLGAGFIAVGAIGAILALAYWGACKIAGPRPPYLRGWDEPDFDGDSHGPAQGRGRG